MKVNPWRGLGELPREVWILCAASLINRAGTMALPFLVLYLTQGVGLSAGQASFGLLVYGLGALMIAPLAGHLSDRMGPLTVMKSSLFVSGAILLIYPFARSYAAILLITLFWAITNEAFRPASLAIVTDLVAPGQRKAAFALVRLAVNLGMSVGPAVGGLLLLISFPAIFVVDAATSILAGLVLVFTRWCTERRQENEVTEPTPSLDDGPAPLGVLADRKLWYFLFAMLPVEIVFFQHISSMPLFLVRNVHLAESAYGILFSINTGMIILVEVPLNNAMSHWLHWRSLMLGAALVGLGFGAFGLTRGFASAVLAVAIWTVGEMMLLPASSAYLADIAPPARRGAYMGLYTMSFSLAFMAGPVLGIKVLEQWGGSVLWGAVLLSGLLSALLMTRLAPAGSPAPVATR